MAPDEAVARIKFLEEQVASLQAQLEWFKRHVFGGGKSETVNALQLRLKLGEMEAALSETQAQVAKEKVTYERSKPAPAKRPTPAEHFANLPVDETIEVVPDEVKANPQAYERVGEEETFEVDIQPPRLFKRRYVFGKFRAINDRTRPLLVAPAPKRACEGGYASAGLLAWVALSKYVDHLPLYRQEKMSERWGVRLSRQVLSDWIGLSAKWFEVIYGLMRKQLLESGYIQVDETPVKFIDPDIKKGKTTQGYLWVISKPGGDVVFDWRLSRRHSEATSLLSGYKGVLQTDGYEAYAALARSSDGDIIHAGCLAHARRKFVEAAEENPKAVRFILRLIGHLYHYEKQWKAKGQTSSKLRAALRQSHYTQTLRLLKNAVQKLLHRARPKSRLGLACQYLIGQWKPLTVALLRGETELDNNLIENAIRPSAIGKKNFLFIGHPDAGQRTAIIYSIVVSCQRHGIDPFAYMKDILTRLPSMTNQDDLSALLPSNWTPQGN